MPGGPPPPACASKLFSDVVATLDADVISARTTPERVYGLTGDDWLIGSATRASCLFGGRGDDVLTMGTGGGVALGERGSDVLTGSWRSDALSGGDGDDSLLAGGSADIVRADKGTDLVDAGPGDDIVDTLDGRPELVNCGAGERDVAVADGRDVLLGCERQDISGPRLKEISASRRPGRNSPARLRFRVPSGAGDGVWRVYLLDCDGTVREAARLPRVRKGRRVSIGLAAPAGGWCAGAQTGSIVRSRACGAGRTCAAPPPPVPWAALRF